MKIIANQSLGPKLMVHCHFCDEDVTNNHDCEAAPLPKNTLFDFTIPKKKTKWKILNEPDRKEI